MDFYLTKWAFLAYHLYIIVALKRDSISYLSITERKSLVQDFYREKIEPALELREKSWRKSGVNGWKRESHIAVNKGGTAEVIRSLWDQKGFFCVIALRRANLKKFQNSARRKF